MKSKFFLVFFLGVLLNISLRVYFHRENYLTKYDPQYWHNRYLASQWVTPESKESIGDDGLYAYAGWQYIHGKDPSLLNPEMPPLGKYIIGATTLVFGNQNIQALLFGMAVLILLYQLARLFLNKTLSIAAVYLFSLEPLFANQLSVSLLDLQELAFLLASLFFFLKFFKSQRTILLFFSLIFLGAMMATKFFVVAFLLGTAYFLSLLVLRQKKSLSKFIFLTPTALGVYILSYTGYFLNAHSFREFLSFQKWTLVFHRESLAFAFPGGPFWMMLFNRWESWFGGLWYRDHVIISAPDWQITWPALLLLTIIFSIKLLRKAHFQKTYLGESRLILALWTFFYLLFLSFIPIFPRYLLLVLPMMYILSFDALSNTDFLKELFFRLKREVKYLGDYLILAFFVLAIFFWKILPLSFGNFVFSPKFAHDLSLTRNIIFGLTPVFEPPPFAVFKSLLLTMPYFLADGNPPILEIFLLTLPLPFALIFYYLLRKKSRKIALGAIFPIVFSFLIFYKLIWEMPVFFPEKEELFFRNEKEVLDFTYRDSKIYNFAFLPLSGETSTEHYQFLYQWFKTRQWRGKNVPPGDNEMHLLYVILEPTYKINDKARERITQDYNVKFQFDQKFSSGIIVWKFARLDVLEKIEKGKNEKH